MTGWAGTSPELDGSTCIEIYFLPEMWRPSLFPSPTQMLYCTQEGDDSVSVLRAPLVAHHLLIGAVEGAVAAAGAAGVAGGLGGAVRAAPTQTHAASEAH